MSDFQVLCTTMHQKDFSLVKKLNLQSDAIITNQSNNTCFESQIIDDNVIEMITTETIGVGKNRNIGLIYASADICLLSDDDVVLRDGYKINIINEFNNHPKADMIIFNIGTSTPQYNRIPTQTKKFKKMHIWSKNPYGAPRIAFRLNEIRKRNIMFSDLFGGGAFFPSGEDSLWISQLLKSGMNIYLSPVYIGDVSYGDSSWYLNDDKYIKFAQGALLEARPIPLKWIYIVYYAIKYKGTLTKKEAIKWMLNGRDGYRNMNSYTDYID